MDHGGGTHGSGGGHDQMLRDMRRPWLWTNGVVMLLGLWLMAAPATFDYASRATTWSDLASRLVLVALAAHGTG